MLGPPGLSVADARVHEAAGRDGGLRGDARPGIESDGAGGLRDERRHGDGGRGLRAHLGHARIRARGDRADGVGAGARRRPRRGRGDVPAHAVEPDGRQRLAQGRDGGRHHRELGRDAEGVARALRAHGGRAGHRGGRGAVLGAAQPRGRGEPRRPGARRRIGRGEGGVRGARGGEASGGAVELAPGRSGRGGCEASRVARADRAGLPHRQLVRADGRDGRRRLRRGVGPGRHLALRRARGRAHPRGRGDERDAGRGLHARAGHRRD